MLFVIILIVISILTACNNKSTSYSFESVQNSKFEHLHGLGYINGGSEIVIATHDGLYEYGDNWKEATSEKHDYMGFEAIREGFYASGHPEPKSSYQNPFGLIKSKDRGASFEKLAFYGGIDFHYLAAGYDSNAIYVLNEMPTKDLSRGIHYTLDEGVTWQQASMNNFDANSISNLAVHPIQQEKIAIGSTEGIYLSNDFGENFRLLSDAKMVVFVMLTNKGGYYSSYENEVVKLVSFTDDNAQVVEIPLPHDDVDPITFIAENPQNEQEIVIATYSNDIYLTKDRGQNWITLATNGELAI